MLRTTIHKGLSLSFVFLLFACVQPQKRSDNANVILLIGDGMGVSQVFAGLTVNHGVLNLLQFQSIGFSMTQSTSDYITDSGAGGTALSTGHKTFNGAIGVGADSLPLKTILEYAEEYGMSTGLVSTCAITDATPASFISHQSSRYTLANVALDFLNVDVEVLIGGGRNDFAARRDSLNLIAVLRDKGYQVIFSADSIREISSGKLGAFTAPSHNPPYLEGRGNLLPEATETAIRILDNNKNGFFLMAEGGHIDKQAHLKDTLGIAWEMIDFDNAIGIALDFAKKDGNTLVLVTADHETAGMSLPNGNIEAGTITAEFGALAGHTGVMVPVFAYGPGAEDFQGIQENTDLFYKMMNVLGIPLDENENP